MRQHLCKVSGCGKAFSRPSHLQRHALNHSNSQWICDRCNACFKRPDLLERHKGRHVIRDRRAGRIGLGILETKRKHFNLSIPSESVSSSPRQSPSQDHSSPFLGQPPSQFNPSPPTTSPYETSLSQNSSINAHSSSPSSKVRDQNWNAAQGLDVPKPREDYLDPQLDFPLTQSPTINQLMGLSPESYEIGDMYHDLAFDLVHFNVTGFTPQLQDYRPLAPQTLPEQPMANDFNGGSQSSLLIPSQSNDGTIIRHEVDARNCSLPVQEQSEQTQPSSEQAIPSGNFMSGLVRTPVVGSESESDNSSNQSAADTSFASDSMEVINPAYDKPMKSQTLCITNDKREDLLDLIAKIRPVHPDGTLIDGDSPEFSLENMQTYLDFFFEYFNTSYPLFHVATLKISDTDPIAVLSIMILGATYKDKDAHQLSVCLYDALMPHILSGLSSSPLPDLSILQAFIVLGCYGMYRAGPYQREHSILIHGLLLNSIRRISRYHVRARITLPDRLTHKERDWTEFAYAEQYKRLILFFFIWDTQNATCYSFMPNMSIQSLHIDLPCSKKLWEATSASEWRELLQEHDNPHTVLSVLKQFAKSNQEILSKPYDNLSFTLALHGLMSMCNDILHFDNCSIYSEHLRGKDNSWSLWREQLTYALESWKAKYDVFAMETIWEMQSEPLHCEFQRDSMSIFALYRISHIVINCEVRHLQTAAGAKAIFGHIVTPSDYEESCRWVRQWVRSSPSTAGNAAWHAAQMFREGMLNLKNWDVHGVFHYPWCLYIGTLTCWAFHHFGAETSSPAQPVCDHSGPARQKELEETSRNKMNHLVATMASVTPANMDRVIGKCCTHGLTLEMSKYLRGVRWTAAFEAMKILEGLSGITEE